MEPTLESMFQEALEKWDYLVNANRDIAPLFFKFKEIPRIPGPTPVDTGITGDMLEAERAFFFFFLKKFSPYREYQEKFQEYLHEHDAMKERQYILTIINGINVWNEDILKIQRFLEALRIWKGSLDKEQQCFEHNDMQTLQEMLKVTSFDILSDPRLLHLLSGTLSTREIDHLSNDIRTFIEKIKSEQSRINSLIEHISAHLEKLKQEFPFLFQGSSVGGQVPA